MANCKVAPGEEGGTKLTFDHQCFLMDYADVLLNRGCPYENFHAIDITTGDSPHDIISTFTKRKSLEKLIRLKPADHGILQPMVRLWRVFPKSELRSDTRAEEEAEFIFSSHINSENVASMTAAQGSLARLGGVGLKKFEWEFAGTNPAEADKVNYIFRPWETSLRTGQAPLIQTTPPHGAPHPVLAANLRALWS